MAEPVTLIGMMDSFAGKRIAVAGDLLLDRYWWGTVTRISPEAPVPIVKLDQTTTVAGGAGNVAANVAKLGADCRMIGCVGNDEEGKHLVELLNNANIKTNHVVFSASRPTCVKTRIVAHNQQVVRVDQEVLTSISDIDAETIVDVLAQTIADTDLIIVSDYAKGTLNQTVLKAVIDEARRKAIPVLVDPKGKDFSKYTGATLITPNRIEAIEACNLEASDPDSTMRAGQMIIDRTGIQNVLVTEGENGMTLFREGNAPFHISATGKQVYDVTGAGDTVIACLGVALAAGIDMATACELANRAAGLAVQRVGTCPISREDLRADLENSISDEHSAK